MSTRSVARSTAVAMFCLSLLAPCCWRLTISERSPLSAQQKRIAVREMWGPSRRRRIRPRPARIASAQKQRHCRHVRLVILPGNTAFWSRGPRWHGNARRNPLCPASCPTLSVHLALLQIRGNVIHAEHATRSCSPAACRCARSAKANPTPAVAR